MPSVSVSLTRYQEPNALVWETLDSLAAQTDIALEVLFFDQQQDAETEAYINNLSNERIRFHYLRIEARGLSYARNCAIEQSKSESLLFIDPDAIADKHWAARMAASLAQPGVALVGGKIIPLWHGQPLFLCRAKGVMDQYSVLDLGDRECEVQRVVGASFGIHKSRAGDQAYFDESYGRRDGMLFGGEESDLSRRVREKGGKILYVGGAVVQHQILPERIRYRWIMKRMFYAGVSRAMQGGTPNPTHQADLWDYVALPFVLPAYALGYLKGKSMAKAETAGY